MAIAVIDFIARHHAAQGQAAGRDVGRGAGHIGAQHIVAGVRAAQGQAADVHRLAAGRVLVAENAAGTGQAQAIARHHAVETGAAGIEQHTAVAVIHLVARLDAADAADDGPADLGRQTGRIAERVIAGQAMRGIAQGGARHRDGLVLARMLVRECRAQTGQLQGLHFHQAAQHGARQAGVAGAVIHLVVGDNAGQRQGFRRDAGAQARGLGHHVVAGQAAGRVEQGRATDAHALARARIFVAKLAMHARHAQGLHPHQSAQSAARQRRRGVAIIRLVAGSHCVQRQHLARDVGRRGGAATGQYIVARVRTGQRDAADMHGLVAAGILVTERGGAAVECQVVAADLAVKQAAVRLHRGSHGAVIRLAIDRNVRHGADAGLADVTRHAVRRCQHIITGHASGGAAAGVCQERLADGDGLVIARVLVRIRALARDAQGFGTDQAIQHTAAEAHLMIAVIHLVGDAGERQCLGRDIGAGAGRADGKRIVARIGAAQLQAADVDRLALARVLVAERAHTVDRQHVRGYLAAKHRRAGIDGGARQTIVDLVARQNAAYAGDQRRRDVAVHVAQGCQDIVAAGTATQGGVASDGDVRADVLAGIATGQRQAQPGQVIAHHANQVSAAQDGRGRAVIHLAVRRDAAQADLARCNSQAAIDIADQVAILGGGIQAADPYRMGADIHRVAAQYRCAQQQCRVDRPGIRNAARVAARCPIVNFAGVGGRDEQRRHERTQQGSAVSIIDNPGVVQIPGRTAGAIVVGQVFQLRRGQARAAQAAGLPADLRIPVAAADPGRLRRSSSQSA